MTEPELHSPAGELVDRRGPRMWRTALKGEDVDEVVLMER